MGKAWQNPSVKQWPILLIFSRVFRIGSIERRVGSPRPTHSSGTCSQGQGTSGEMKSWGCPWFPFVLELLREAAAKSPSPLMYEGGIQSLSPLANSDFVALIDYQVFRRRGHRAVFFAPL